MSLDIQNIIDEGETIEVEFKTAFNNDVIVSLCAMANSKGGTILIGIEDNRRISGIHVNHEIIKDWINQIKSKTIPSLVPDYDIKFVDNKQILLFRITEFPVKPVSFLGRYYKRVGASNHQLTADEIVEFRFVSLNVSFDSFTIETVFEELDPTVIEVFVKKTEQAGRFNFSGEIKSNLSKLGFINKNKLTRAAELLFGNHHTAIHIGRFKTPDMILDDIVIRSPLIVAVDESMDFIKKNIGLGYEFTGELQRKNRWQFPLEVIRELLLNTVIHKDYRNPTDIIIKIFDDRIEFSNPGGLFGNLKPEDLLSDNYPAKHRNRLLAEAFYLAGEVEKYGTGFIRIRKSLESYPELGIKIIDLSDFIKVELGTKDVTKDVGLNVRKGGVKGGVKDVGLNGVKDITKDGGIIVGKDVGLNVRKGGVKGGEKEISEIQILIFAVIKRNPRITFSEIIKNTGIARRTVERSISFLKNGKYIKREGGRKNGYWEILKNE
jgi:ATP-dependent DNA helicase RecG